MLLATDFQPKFWKEAVRTTVYTLNQTQMRQNNEKSPHELWKGRLSSVKILQYFWNKMLHEDQ